MVNRKSNHSHSQLKCRLLISHRFPLCDVLVVCLLISHRFPLCDVGVVRLHGAMVCLLVLCSEGERTGSSDVRPTTSASRLVSQCLIVWCDEYYLYLNVSKTKDVCWHWE